MFINIKIKKLIIQQSNLRKLFIRDENAQYIIEKIHVKNQIDIISHCLLIQRKAFFSDKASYFPIYLE